MDQSTPERWLPVVGYEGFYEVSDLGRVRSLDRLVGNQWGTQTPKAGRVLKPGLRGPRGYLSVTLCVDHKVKHRLVHQLVLEAFTGPRPGPSTGLNRIEGRHLDDDPSNNTPANLAWGTRQENWEDRRRNGGDYQSAKTHCPYGHPYSPENTYIITISRTGRKVRSCKTCVKRRQQQVRARVERGPNNATKTHCKHGHPFDEANTQIRLKPDGTVKQRICLACKRKRGAERARVVRAAKRVARLQALERAKASEDLGDLAV
jgi:NUMOD4 motif/HNH endonuclease